MALKSAPTPINLRLGPEVPREADIDLLELSLAVSEVFEERDEASLHVFVCVEYW